VESSVSSGAIALDSLLKIIRITGSKAGIGMIDVTTAVSSLLADKDADELVSPLISGYRLATDKRRNIS